MGFSLENAHICTQIFLIVPNIQNPHRDTAEILKLHELGMRLLSNPNKYGYLLLFPSTESLKICMVGAFSVCKIHFAPTLPTLQQIFGFYCIFIRNKICIYLQISVKKILKVGRYLQKFVDSNEPTYLSLDLSSIWCDLCLGMFFAVSEMSLM